MPSCLVLLYHAFGDRSPTQDPHNLFVTAPAFRAQLEHLLRSGRRPLTVDEWLAGLERRSWPRGSFLVTIDDGYVSTLGVAAPILRELDVPAVLFAVAGRLGGVSDWMPAMPDEPLLDAAALNALPGYGISVGCHTYDHTDLRGASAAELTRQTREANEVLAAVTGVAPRTFAYPFGWYDAHAATAVADAGFQAGFAIRAPLGRFTVPRVDVNATDTPRTFAMKTRPWWPAAMRVAEKAPRLRRAAHQLVGMARR